MAQDDKDERTPEEAERIMNAALKRALSMSPKPHKPTAKSGGKEGAAKPRRKTGRARPS